MTKLQRKCSEHLKQCFLQKHCAKSVQIGSYFWSIFSRSRTEYGEIFLVRIQSECGKIRTRNNSVFGHFSRSEIVKEDYFRTDRYKQPKTVPSTKTYYGWWNNFLSGFWFDIFWGIFEKLFSCPNSTLDVTSNNFELKLIADKLTWLLQKQSSIGVLKKRCSKNMQQIYRRTPIPKYDFNKITLRHGCFPVNLLHIFGTPFPRNTSRWLILLLSDGIV